MWIKVTVCWLPMLFFIKRFRVVYPSFGAFIRDREYVTGRPEYYEATHGEVGGHSISYWDFAWFDGWGFIILSWRVTVFVRYLGRWSGDMKVWMV